MRTRILKTALVLAMLGAASCGGDGGGGGGGGGSGGGATPPPGTGSVSGTLLVPGTLAAAQLANSLALGSRPPTASPKPQADFVPGEVLIRFKGGVDEGLALAALLQKYSTVRLTNIGPIYPGGPYLLRTDAYQNESISKEEARRRTQEVIGRLQAEPSVAYAEPNYRRQPARVPNDPAFRNSLQWDMRLIKLPSAWEITTGRPDIIVAVLDSGIRSHADLNPNVTDGFDFVSNRLNAGDGDGLDPNPTEPSSPLASFHGTHVAGTIAAVGNNGIGMTGVAWTAKIMPVRVIGLIGAEDADVINGMRYAAGLPNASGTVPPQRAHVINMSLGGPGPCSQAFQEAITAVRNAGVTIVVAAGNDAENGNPIESPASCPGVLAVGAVDILANRAPYSGFQPYVFIAAPGGDLSEVVFGGTLSTFSTSGTARLFKFEQGTSMAAPHVAGVVALMQATALSVPTTGRALTPAEVETILADTASDLGPAGRDPEYGHGLIDAYAAVAGAVTLLGGTPAADTPVAYPLPPIAVLTETEDVRFSAIDSVTLNLGGGTLNVQGVTAITVFQPAPGPWLSAGTFNDPTRCPAPFVSLNCIVRISADRASLASGVYTGRVDVTTATEVFGILALLRVGAAIRPDLGTVAVRLIGLDPATERLVVRAMTTTTAAQGWRYAFAAVPPGDYFVDAGIDRDGSGFFGDAPDEVSGMYPFPGAPESITVTAGQATTGITFSITDEQTIVSF